MKTYGRKRPFQRCTSLDLDFREICRLCLCSTGDKYNIFGIVSDVPLPSKILTCLAIEVCEGDGLPSEVCLKCLKLLETFYKFRKKCEEVNYKLQDISRKLREVQPQGKFLQQNQEVNEKLSIMELLYADKETNSEVILNESRCIMDSLLNACASTEGNISSFQGESLSHSVNKVYNNNNTNLKVNSDQHEIVPNSKIVGEWQNSGDSGTETNNFHVDENISSHIKNMSANDIRSMSTENSISNDDDTVSSQPLNNNVKLEPLPAVSAGLIFICEKCPKGFSKRIDLKRHSSVHDQTRGFDCSQCEKWFPNKTSFKRHERIHTGERPFCCSYCQKCFSQESILSRHMLIHTGEKPYKCETCGKTFTQREGLKVHMRRHDHGNQDTQQQQYYCPLCKKGFCHQSGLSRHLVTHTGKTFDCSVCSKSFSDQSSLKRHTKRHSSVCNDVGP